MKRKRKVVPTEQIDQLKSYLEPKPKYLIELDDELDNIFQRFNRKGEKIKNKLVLPKDNTTSTTKPLF